MKKKLEVFNNKNDDQIAKMIERDKIRAEVQVEINAKAQEFVNEQIKQAHALMYEEIERQVAQRVSADKVQLSQDPPLCQNRNPAYEEPSEPMELSNWEMSQAPSGKGVLGELQNLTKRMLGRHDELANLIGNASDME